MKRISITALAILISAAFSQSALALTEVATSQVSGSVPVGTATSISALVEPAQGLVAGVVAHSAKMFTLKISYQGSDISKLGWKAQRSDPGDNGTWYVTNGDSSVLTGPSNVAYDNTLIDGVAVIDADGTAGIKNVDFVMFPGSTLNAGDYSVTGTVYAYRN